MRATNRTAAATIALAGVTGLGLLAVGATRTPPRPPRPHTTTTTTDPAAGRPAAPAPPLPRANPTHLTIPAIRVRADIVSVATTSDGALEVPPPDRPTVAGWYRLGVSPGEAGNAVIVGHVNTRDTGPAVFFDLGRLHPGDRILVTRADATNVTFAVDDVRSYPKTAFPADLVYGTGPTPRLRLVTCGGPFDEPTGAYLDNVIVFATALP